MLVNGPRQQRKSSYLSSVLSVSARHRCGQWRRSLCARETTLVLESRSHRFKRTSERYSSQRAHSTCAGVISSLSRTKIITMSNWSYIHCSQFISGDLLNFISVNVVSQYLSAGNCRTSSRINERADDSNRIHFHLLPGTLRNDNGHLFAIIIINLSNHLNSVHLTDPAYLITFMQSIDPDSTQPTTRNYLMKNILIQMILLFLVSSLLLLQITQ